MRCDGRDSYTFFDPIEMIYSLKISDTRTNKHTNTNTYTPIQAHTMTKKHIPNYFYEIIIGIDRMNAKGD